MASVTTTWQAIVPNRRRRVRHRIQTPAYACFRTELGSTTLDLHEIVNISEDGLSIQCHTPLEVDRQVHLCLDLAECPEQIYTTGQVVWSNEFGRCGLRFATLSAASFAQLREWLFINVTAGVANGEVEQPAPEAAAPSQLPPPNYTDTLAAVTAVQRQVEALGPDLAGVLQLVAERAQALVRASGAAIALLDAEPDFMICRASAGADAPPVGVRLQVGSGFSGECVKGGLLLRCDDTEVDPRVDREGCRALGIRSILAAPVRAGDQSVGLVEVFSAQPNAFTEADGRVLQRLAEAVLEAANRTTRAEKLPPLGATGPAPFVPPQGSVLFAAADQQNKQDSPAAEKGSAVSISLPRSNLIVLVCAAATIALALGYRLAPWIQSEAAPWVQSRLHTRAHTVLASSQPPKAESANPATAVETANLEQLQQMADKGDAAAQNALGLRYASGEGVVLSESEAARWFTKAAEQGFVPAQSKLGSFYFSGRGVPQDITQAYFWMVLARLGGDVTSNALAPHARARLTRAQITAIELDADRWLQQHQTGVKPVAGQFRAQN